MNPFFCLFFDYFGINFSFKNIDMMLTLNSIVQLFENFELVCETKKVHFEKGRINYERLRAGFKRHCYLLT
ncbi:hypothetical protein CON00_04870 [Bacillus sp. AFS096315]|nr:hypothetical protein CON00_04870 [Bacillus sp. AFS096315]